MNGRRTEEELDLWAKEMHEKLTNMQEEMRDEISRRLSGLGRALQEDRTKEAERKHDEQ